MTLLTLLALISCNGSTGPDTGQSGLLLGEEQTCPTPTEGLARFEESGAERGLDLVYEASTTTRRCPVIPGGIAAGDLDGDGDEDLAFHRLDGFPALYSNDGQGHFQRAEVDVSWEDSEGREPLAIGLADRNGDGLPEIWVVSESLLRVSENLGDLDFGPFVTLFDEPDFPRTCFHTVAFGDIEGDGDLDVLLPGADLVPDADHIVPEQPPWTPAIDRLLLNQDGDLSQVLEISRGEMEAMALVGLFTDWDDDADLDVLLTTDRAYEENAIPMGWYRNDGMAGGLPVLTDIASDLGGDTLTNAMGVGVADLNGDQALDYCLSDLAPVLMCLLSDDTGGFYQAGTALGLVPDVAGHPDLPGETTNHEIGEAEAFWTTWGLELEDLDNDGYLDLATVAGGVPHHGNVALNPNPDFLPDSLYQGTAEGFIDVSHASDFHDPTSNYGLVAADFEGDGALDLVVGPHEGTPVFWSNPCTSGSWLGVELRGPAGNSEGFGARVTAVVDGVEVPREVHGPRMASQGPSSVHFGLGEETVVDQLMVRWPDGCVQSFENVPTRRMVTVVHPQAP